MNMREDRVLNIIIASHLDFENLYFTVSKIMAYKLVYVKLIIVDSGQDKRTLEYLKSISSSVRFISEADAGIADAWNKGVKLIENGWVMFLGCGDSISKIDLNKIISKINKIGKKNVIYGDTILISKNNYQIKRSATFHFNENKSFPFMHPSVVVPFGIFKHIGVFDNTYRFAMDSDWLTRVFLSKKYNFIQCDHSVEMLDNGLSVQNWFSANLEFLKSKKIHFQIGNIKYILLFLKILCVYIINLKLKLSKTLHFIKKTSHNIYITYINIMLKFTPFFFLRFLIVKYLLRIIVDSSCSIHRSVSFKTLGNLKIGINTVINKNVYFDNSNSIIIGSNVSISQNTKFLTLGHDINDSYFKTKGKPIFIDDYCVLFSGCYILPGTKLYWGSVVYPNVTVNGTYNKSVVLSSSNVVLRERVQDELKYSLKYKDWFC